ncbi:beta-ketoacyl synthase N-terminal-like domain-containing protein [Saccharopolyspora sp. NPDC049357]|uniref:beta-ketoacyl synthase N-terminal-like domain-containing protein n=1 Tax=Saccharopolyspora sp. NPDC049357 TaxID=3154507 RepID=UPI003437A224
MTTTGVHQRSIAIVGMSCRLPGATDPDRLWELLCGGVDATAHTPAERYDAAALRSSGPGGLAGCRAGFVDGIADFDADFFDMSAAEATALDPQQRLLLMCAWEAFEDAGVVPEQWRGSRTGVFVGNSRADFLESALQQGLSSATATQLGNVRSLLPARLSHHFDLRGPSVVIDTACSSALTAVHQAVQSLRSGETPAAVVAGVNLPLRPDEAVMMSHAGAMSADGRSRFGSADADGHAPSDAVAVVVLKPMEAALADGDRVRAVIAGSAVGNDGRSSDSVLNPSLEGQLDVLRWAYRDARVEPSAVDFVEAHGSGSPLLDPLELTALGRFMGTSRSPDRPLLVGSVKSNLGHAEAAGGLVGLIKAALCLENGKVPASLHAGLPRTDVDWSGLSIPRALTDIPSRAIAGVSAQGSSALNAHVVLRSAEHEPRTPDDGTRWPLVLSARTPEALADLTRAYVEHLSGSGADFPVRDLCRSAALRRTRFEHRAVAIGATHRELVESLTTDSTPELDRFLGSESVDRDGLFGPGRHVPLPTYPWQTRRYWPGEEPAGDDPAEWLLGKHARTAFDQDSALADIGIDSLAKLQLLVEVQQRTGREVDPEELAALRTVRDLCRWARELAEVRR